MCPFRKHRHWNGRPTPPGAALIPFAVIFAILTLTFAWPRETPAQGTWSETGSMTTGRTLHPAALVPGSRVLVAGGMSAAGAALTSAELLDSRRGRWRTVGPLDTGRFVHTATPLFDGRVLVAGGIGTHGVLFSAEIYTPVTDTWSYTGSMTFARAEHTATQLADGRVLVAGGFGEDNKPMDNAEIYDPAMNGWSRGGSFATARYHHTATLLANGRVLVAGGDGDGVLCLDSAVIYDPATNGWAGTTSLTICRRSHTATLLLDGRVLVAGGALLFTEYFGPVAEDSAELFDPATETWSSTGSMNDARFGHTATLLLDGRVLVMGGVGGTGEGTAINKAEIYDPAKGTWKSVASPNDARVDHTATLLDDGRVVVAGTGLGEVPLSSVTIFDPLNFVTNGSFETATLDPGDSWIRLGSGSTTLFRWNVVGEGGVDYRGDWQAAEARRSVDLNSTGPGTIAQVLSTSSRGGYRVTFSMAGHTGGPPAVKTLRVYAGDQFRDFTFDTTGKDIGNMGWTTKEWSFTTNTGLTVLKFQSLTAGSYGPAIDNVRVVQESMNATMALPESQLVFTPPSSSTPVLNANPALANPIGLGSVASGGDTLDIRIGTVGFSGPAEVYFAVYSPDALGSDIFLYSDGTFVALSQAGTAPWIANTAGPLDQNLFGAIPVSALPSGAYTLFLAVAPAGSSLATFYLWSVAFTVP